MGNTLSECCRSGSDHASRSGELPPPWLLPRGNSSLTKQDASMQTGSDLFDFLHQTSVETASLRRAETPASEKNSGKMNCEIASRNASLDRCFLFCEKSEVRLLRLHVCQYLGAYF